MAKCDIIGFGNGKRYYGGWVITCIGVIITFVGMLINCSGCEWMSTDEYRKRCQEELDRRGCVD